MARIHVVVLRRTDPSTTRDPDLEHLAERIDELTTSWTDRLRSEVTSVIGEREGHALLERFGDGGIPVEYQAVTDPRAAVTDLRRLVALDRQHGLATSLLARVDGPPDEMRFKVYRRGDPLTLSAVLPLLEHLGLTVVDERPFELRPVGESRAWIYDIGVRLPPGATVDGRTSEELQATFRASLRGEVDNDGLNRLVLLAAMTGRQVAIVRTYVKYLRQIGFPFSQATIEATLARHAPIAGMIADLFDARFDPARDDGREEIVSALVEQISTALDDVPSLDDDRVGRSLLGLVNATLRTNAFQPDRPVIAIKLDPTRVPDLPQPRPMFEIFVYSPRVEGVHLRGGRIARGGLRWSDRREDFRTETLGLMKAQMVKNAVIVPVGAKGGFVVKQAPSDPEAMRAEVVSCYRQFVAGLLDLTDNIVGETVVPPAATVRYDGDDPYLVVAADKGTATLLRRRQRDLRHVRLLARRRVRLRGQHGLRPQGDGHHGTRRVGERAPPRQGDRQGRRPRSAHGRRHRRHERRRVRQRHVAIRAPAARRRLRPPSRVPRPHPRPRRVVRRAPAPVRPAPVELGRLRPRR